MCRTLWCSGVLNLKQPIQEPLHLLLRQRMRQAAIHCQAVLIKELVTLQDLSSQAVMLAWLIHNLSSTPKVRCTHSSFVQLSATWTPVSECLIHMLMLVWDFLTKLETCLVWKCSISSCWKRLNLSPIVLCRGSHSYLCSTCKQSRASDEFVDIVSRRCQKQLVQWRLLLLQTGFWDPKNDANLLLFWYVFSCFCVERLHEVFLVCKHFRNCAGQSRLWQIEKSGLPCLILRATIFQLRGSKKETLHLRS